MGTKRRTVVGIDAAHLVRIEELVATGRYASPSDFVREAVDEKLARELVADEVSRYCRAGHADEDAHLIAAQPLHLRG